MENGLSLTTTRNLNENETSWVDQAMRKISRKNIMQLPKNDSLEFAENADWIQVGKK